MSFGGHVFDMIRRDKAYRDDRRRRRDRAKGRNLHLGTGMPSNITVEELDEINRRTKAREEEQQRYFIRMMLIVLGGLAVVTLLLAGIFMLLF